MKFAPMVAGGLAAILLCACEAPDNGSSTAPPAPPSGPELAPTPEPPEASNSPIARTVDRASWSATPVSPEALRDVMIRAEVLLDRAHFSPGVIDGRDGENVRNAVAAFERANGLPEDGVLDDDVWARLTADSGPILTDYVISGADAAGPYTPEIPKEYEDMAKLDRLGFTSPLEALAERFHMDQALLQALNPGVDFSAPGTRIVVAAVGPAVLPQPVDRIEVDKARKQVRAYSADGRLIAAYPATVGSADLPTPSGELAVRAIASAPTWTYDPARLNFGDRSAGKLIIKAGPNNPVGAVWIDLSRDTYGIHGAPEPRLVGKSASHGCVRMTNWDAQQLAKAVQKGAKVAFLGEAAGPSATPA